MSSLHRSLANAQLCPRVLLSVFKKNVLLFYYYFHLYNCSLGLDSEFQIKDDDVNKQFLAT